MGVKSMFMNVACVCSTANQNISHLSRCQNGIFFLGYFEDILVLLYATEVSNEVF